MSIDFTLRPTNPSSFKDSKIVDDALKEISCKKAGIHFENKKDGLNVEGKNNFLGSSIALCEQGYGNFKAHTEKGDEAKTMDSSSKIIKESPVRKRE